jgi:hypothetical protein
MIMTRILREAMNARADDILRAIRLERRRSAIDYVVSAAQWAVVGAVVGGCIALLLAPNSGEDLRNQIGSKLQNARMKARDAATNMKRRSSNARTNQNARSAGNA